ncbi:MAG: hypothetical protein ACRDAX_03260 [Propionibacteriaceae bacterium]
MTAWKPEPSSGTAGIVPPAMPAMVPGSNGGPSAPIRTNLSLPGAQPSYDFSGDSDGIYVGKAPWKIIVIAMALALLGGGIGFLLGQAPIFALLGWAISGPIAMAVLAFFTLRDTKVRARGVYSQLSFVPILYWIAMGICIAATLICAWRIGDWAGRL